jgi:hypothetical protein
MMVQYCLDVIDKGFLAGSDQKSVGGGSFQGRRDYEWTRLGL